MIFFLSLSLAENINCATGAGIRIQFKNFSAASHLQARLGILAGRGDTSRY